MERKDRLETEIRAGTRGGHSVRINIVSFIGSICDTCL